MGNAKLKIAFAASLTVSVILLALVLGIFTPVSDRREDGPGPGMPKDGVYSYHTIRANTKDKFNEGAPVTADGGWIKLADGSVHSGPAYSAGYVTFSGIDFREGEVVTIEVDSSTAHYPIQRKFTIGDITVGDQYQGFYLVKPTLMMWGMDASDDAGVLTCDSGSARLINGTDQANQDDAFAVSAATPYLVSVNFNWIAADEESFGVEPYTQIHDKGYEYRPYMMIKTTELVIIEDVNQDDVLLYREHFHDDGAAAWYIYQIIPIFDDTEVDGDEEVVFQFTAIFPLAAADTIDVTFYAEHRVDRAKTGTMITASETLGQLTTT